MKMESKYDVGDVVYFADAHPTTEKAPCPDCSGSQLWTAKSPAGAEYEIPCPRCTNVYQSDSGLSLRYTAYHPTAVKRTVGSVRFSTEGETEYMCHETGVGSGTIYRESSLHLTEEAALHAAKIIALAGDLRPEIKAMHDRAITISDYQLSDAKIKLARTIAEENQSFIYRYGELIEELEKCSDMNGVRSALKFHEFMNEEEA